MEQIEKVLKSVQLSMLISDSKQKNTNGINQNDIIMRDLEFTLSQNKFKYFPPIAEFDGTNLIVKKNNIFVEAGLNAGLTRMNVYIENFENIFEYKKIKFNINDAEKNNQNPEQFVFFNQHTPFRNETIKEFIKKINPIYKSFSIYNDKGCLKLEFDKEKKLEYNKKDSKTKEFYKTNEFYKELENEFGLIRSYNGIKKTY